MDIGSVLRLERERRRLTQSEVAEVVGTTRQAIAALEDNRGRVVTLMGLEALMRLHLTGLRRAESIIQEIALTRARKGWSLRNLAQRAEISVNTVRALEIGTGSITALCKLLEALAPGGRVSVHEARRRPGGLVTVGYRSNPNRDPLDYYPTPPALVRLLLDHEVFTRDYPILEPCLGEARVIDRVLRERGYSTICSDVNGVGAERRCFFDIQEAHHTIITNPPFHLHLKFVQHAKRIATTKIAMLMPLNFLTGAERHVELWSETEFPLARVHVLNRGVDFERSDPASDRFKASQMYMAWYVFEKTHVGPPHLNWIDSHAWVARSSNQRSVNTAT